MSNSENLKKLLKLSSEMSALVDVEMAGLNNNINDVLRNAPEEQKKEIAGVKTMFTRAINLSKKGRTQEANELINNYKNGCKGSK